MVSILVWGFLVLGIAIALLGFPGVSRLFFKKDRNKSLDHEGW